MEEGAGDVDDFAAVDLAQGRLEQRAQTEADDVDTDGKVLWVDGVRLDECQR